MTNRSEGARGLEEWRPPDESYWCQYATDWAEIKAWWELTMTDAEAEAVVLMLHTCENTPEVVMEGWEALGTRVGEHKPTAEPEGTVYSSCEEASEAGEQRVQGSHGAGGRGSRQNWSPAPGTATGMGWYVKDRSPG